MIGHKVYSNASYAPFWPKKNPRQPKLTGGANLFPIHDCRQLTDLTKFSPLAI